MSQQVRFSTGGERVRETLAAALEWCDTCCLVSDAPTEQGDVLWADVERHASRVRAAILSNLESANTESLRTLHAAGALRHFVDGTRIRGHFAWFERGDELRFVVAPGALRASTVQGPGLWLFWEGRREALAEGLQATIDACWSSSVPVAGSERVGGVPTVLIDTDYSRPIPAVREVLGIRTIRNFFDLDEDAQELALWSTLIGEGAVDLEQAIRLSAERLRAQGFLEYQVLRQDGRVRAVIEERLLAARRRTELFDRPKNGFVRAIQPNLDELTAEQWRDCIMSALEPGARVDREQAVRMGFVHAQTYYGVQAQRLRGGGKAEQALRSAINSSIRQGYLARDGAAYLIRSAGPAEPTLRGELTFEEDEDDTQVSGHVLTVPNEPAPVGQTAPSDQARSVQQTAPVRPAEPPAPEPTPGVAPALPAGHGGEPTGVMPDAAEPPSPLDMPLLDLDLPTRAGNWADRQSLQTVRDLVAWHPQAFENERNVGRRTVRETRELIEAHLGCSWEEAYSALRGGSQPPVGAVRGGDDEEVDSATEELTAGGPAGWAAMARSLSDDQRALALTDVQLPTRMRNFVRGEGLQSLGDLFRLAHGELTTRKNLGRKSLNDTLDAVRDYLSERASPPMYASFREAWQAQLSALEPIPRMIVTRRAGMHGTRETLEELAGMLGVTRERVRQIEARVIERLRERSRWRRMVEEKLTVAFGAGRALPLDLLAQEPWWAAIDTEELLLDYVVRRIFEDELFLLEAPSGKRYLTKFAQEQFAQRLESAKSRVAKLEYPVEVAVIDELLRSEAEPLDSVLFPELRVAIDELLLVDPERPELALGYGRYRDQEVVAFLNGQAEPVPVALVEERCGRGRMPEEVLYFKRGLVGLKRHFPDFEGWTQRLVPAALDVMKERAPGRQWLVPEIHEALRERGQLPEWLGHWHLASVLRLSGAVDYLGRLRVASKDSGHERLHFEDLLEQLLEHAGSPLEFDELLARARTRTDVRDATATLIVSQAPFVRLDEKRVGLVERDIPGGPQAVAEAIEAVVQHLTETEHGLTPHQATLLVHRLSAVHATWSRQLVTSVLRNEARVRIDRSKNIGLDDWDDVRCPARAEFMRREVQKAGGSLSVDDLCARLADTFGRAPDRGTLGVLAQEAGLAITDNRISRPASVIPEAPPSPADTTVPGIPAELREMFEDLMKESLSPVIDLRAQIAEHLAALEDEHRVNEFVDLQGGHQIARQCYQLLGRWESLPLPDRHVAHAAIRYFVSWHDVEHDLDIGGLDDDKQIMNAVFEHLGMDEGTDGIAAA